MVSTGAGPSGRGGGVAGAPDFCFGAAGAVRAVRAAAEPRDGRDEPGLCPFVEPRGVCGRAPGLRPEGLRGIDMAAP